MFRGPARTCEPAAGQTSARGGNDRPRSGRFAHGPLPPPLSQVRSLVEERPNIDPFLHEISPARDCSRSLYEERQMLPGTQRHRTPALAAQWGTVGTPYAATRQKEIIKQ